MLATDRDTHCFLIKNKIDLKMTEQEASFTLTFLD